MYHIVPASVCTAILLLIAVAPARNTGGCSCGILISYPQLNRFCKSHLQLIPFASPPAKFTGDIRRSEFVAVVEKGPPEWLGKGVVGEINLACRNCDWRQRGLARHCPKRTVPGIVKHPGAFAEFLTLPAENLLEVPESLST